jgi:hypothetical protein
MARITRGFATRLPRISASVAAVGRVGGEGERGVVAVERHEPSRPRPEQAAPLGEDGGGVRDMAEERVHDHHVEAALRQVEPMRVALAAVDPPAEPLRPREEPPRFGEVAADVDGDDLPLHLGAARGPGRHPGAAAEVEHRLRSGKG